MATPGPSGVNSSRSTPGGQASTSSPVSRSRVGMPTSGFTRIQQDQQARNKEPNADTFDDDSSDDGGRFGEYDLYVLLATTSKIPFLHDHLFDIAFFGCGRLSQC
ncbi:hypothetical protein ACMFMG_007319 [Clarireedia jacksonii]